MSAPEVARVLYQQGLEYYKSGDYSSARRSLLTSLDKYETRDANELLQKIEAVMLRGSRQGMYSMGRSSEPQTPVKPTQTQQQQQQQQQKPKPPPQPSTPQQPKKTAPQTQTNHTKPNMNTNAGSNHKINGPNGEYTQIQQQEAVRIIQMHKKKGHTHYDVLSVTKTSTEEEIKKSYRKIALKLHPDRNRAPEAEEAFKIVTNSHGILTDTKKRQIYDQTGCDDEASYAQQNHQQHFYSHQRSRYSQHGEMDLNDFLNMLFNDGRRPKRRAPQQERNRQQQQDQPLMMSLLSFLPIIGLILLSVLSGFSSKSTPEFSLSRSTSHPIPRSTHHGVPFYVDETFVHKYGRNKRVLLDIEDQINSEYLSIVKEECIKERKFKNLKIEQAKSIYGKDNHPAIQKAYRIALEKCQLHDSLRNKGIKDRNGRN